tara:strand:+ start:5108 stop:6919 length:1812 start_codon:yes stop_codon:yes gene_type:complete
MNFNLISPENNGYDYQVYFKEPIDIGASSKISLNWAELTRGGKIVLREQQTITITADSVLPRKVPSGAFDDNKVFNSQASNSKTISIPKGSYTFTDFEITLSDKLTAALGTNLKYYETADNIVDGNKMDFGLELGQEYLDQTTSVPRRDQFDFSASPNLLAKTVKTSGSTGFAYLKDGGSAATYDSFAMDTVRHYFHYQIRSDDIFSASNYIYLQASDKTAPTGGQSGTITFGLYGKEYADGIGTINPTRTASGLGNTISVDANGEPRNFLNLKVGEYAGNIELFWADNTTNGNIEAWDSQGLAIDTMERIFSVPVATVFSSGEVPKFAFRTYIDVEEGSYSTNPRMFFQLWRSVSDDRLGDLLLYDSKSGNHFFPPEFFVAEAGNTSGIAYGNANEINSVIPFNIALYADTDDMGWRVCAFRSFTKGLEADFATNPQTIIERYTLSFSAQLASALGLTSIQLHPNALLIKASPSPNSNPVEGVQPVVLLRSQLDINWKKDNYSIFIDLPINAYKNINNVSDGGFKKNILANLPSPFSIGTVIENISSDNEEIISTYQPYQIIVNDMKNNPIKVNSVKIRIVDMLDENLATELTRSIINFSIN